MNEQEPVTLTDDESGNTSLILHQHPEDPDRVVIDLSTDAIDVSREESDRIERWLRDFREGSDPKRALGAELGHDEAITLRLEGGGSVVVRCVVGEEGGPGVVLSSPSHDLEGDQPGRYWLGLPLADEEGGKG